APIALAIIRREMGIVLDVILHHRVKRGAVTIGNDYCFDSAVTLQHSPDYGLVVEGINAVFHSAVSVHETGLTADECFIHFDVPVQFSPCFLHSQTDAVSHEPCGFLGYSQAPVKFIAADSVLIVTDHPHCSQPFIEADCAVFHDRSNFDTELPPFVFVHTLPKTACSKEM